MSGLVSSAPISGFRPPSSRLGESRGLGDWKAQLRHRWMLATETRSPPTSFFASGVILRPLRREGKIIAVIGYHGERLSRWHAKVGLAGYWQGFIGCLPSTPAVNS